MITYCEKRSIHCNQHHRVDRQLLSTYTRDRQYIQGLWFQGIAWVMMGHRKVDNLD